MNSSPVTTGASAITGAMLAGVIVWLCSVAGVTPPPVDVAGTLGALFLAGAHALFAYFTKPTVAAVPTGESH